MSRRTALTCIVFAVLSQVSAGCYCYRPFLSRFNPACWPHCYGPNGAGLAHAPAPPAPLFAGPMAGPMVGPMSGPVFADGSAGGCSSCFSSPGPVHLAPGPMVGGLPHGMGGMGMSGPPVFLAPPATVAPPPQVFKDAPAAMPPTGGAPK